MFNLYDKPCIVQLYILMKLLTRTHAQSRTHVSMLVYYNKHIQYTYTHIYIWWVEARYRIYCRTIVGPRLVIIIIIIIYSKRVSKINLFDTAVEYFITVGFQIRVGTMLSGARIFGTLYRPHTGSSS